MNTDRYRSGPLPSSHCRSPSDDDRRGSTESWDTRRDTYRMPRESYAGRDRDRDRSRETSPARDTRDRRDGFRPLPREAPREPSGSRGDVFGQLPRSRVSSGSVPTPSNHVAVSDPSSVVKFIKAWADAIEERAAIKMQLSTLERVSKQRDREYENSKSKYTDFPSVPELHQKFRAREKEKKEELRKKAKQIEAVVDKTSAEFLQELLKALPLADMKARFKESGSQQLKELEFKLAGIKNTMQQNSNHAKKQMQTFPDDIKKVNQVIEKLLKASETTNAQLRQFIESQETAKKQLQHCQKSKADKSYVDSQIQNLRHEFTSQLEKERKSHKDEIKRLEVAMARQQADHQAQLQKILGNSIQKEEPRKSQQSSLEQDKASETDISSLRLDQSQTHKLISNLTKQLETVIDTQRQHAEALGKQEDKVKSLEETVYNADLKTVEQWADFYSLTWPGYEFDLDSYKTLVPGLKANVEGVDAQIGSLKQELENIRKMLNHGGSQSISQDARHSSQDAGDSSQKAGNSSQALVTQHQFNKWGKEIANWIDQRKKICDDREKQTTQLSSDLRDLVANLGPLLEAAKRVEKLEQMETTLHGIKGDITGVQAKVQEDHDYFAMVTGTLNSQYNNISTKDLAERIIQTLEQIYPNAHRITSDLNLVKTKLSSLGIEMGNLKKQFGSSNAEMSNVNGRLPMSQRGSVERNGSSESKRRRLD